MILINLILEFSRPNYIKKLIMILNNVLIDAELKLKWRTS